MPVCGLRSYLGARLRSTYGDSEKLPEERYDSYKTLYKRLKNRKIRVLIPAAGRRRGLPKQAHAGSGQRAVSVKNGPDEK